MKIEDKNKSIAEVLMKLEKLPITLPISQAENIVLSQWIAKIAELSYERGFEDGQKIRSDF